MCSLVMYLVRHLHTIAFVTISVILWGQPAIAETTEERLARLEEQVRALQDAIQAIKANGGQRPVSGAISGVPSPLMNSESVCPLGFYVVGVNSWKSSPEAPYCFDCLTGLIVTCRPL